MKKNRRNAGWGPYLSPSIESKHILPPPSFELMSRSHRLRYSQKEAALNFTRAEVRKLKRGKSQHQTSTIRRNRRKGEVKQKEHRSRFWTFGVQRGGGGSSSVDWFVYTYSGENPLSRDEREKAGKRFIKVSQGS